MVRHDDRGQLFTVEGFVAALIVLSSVVFALTMTAATPLSASSANQHLETQQQATAASLLDTAKASDSLRPTLLYWDESRGSFHGTSPKGYYLACEFDTALGEQLARSLETRGTACNVNIQYMATNGVLRTERLVYVGEPTDNAVRVTTFVTLYDDDVLRDADGDLTGTTLAEAEYFAPDISSDRLYTVVRIEVITWRT